jgi:hypothetical protein
MMMCTQNKAKKLFVNISIKKIEELDKHKLQE